MTVVAVSAAECVVATARVSGEPREMRRRGQGRWLGAPSSPADTGGSRL